MYSIDSQYMMVTPSIAQQWLVDYRYPLQRRPRKAKIAMYASIMKRGDWQQDKELKLVKLDGSTYLVNGQHRLHALAECGVPQMFNVVTVTVSDESQLAAIYNTEDNNITRTFDDVMRTTLLPNTTGISQWDLSKLKPAIIYIRGGFGVDRAVSADSWEIASLIENVYGEPYAAFLEAIAGAKESRINRTKRKFQRASVLSVALVTYMESVNQFGIAKIDEFWSGAANDDGLRRGDPRKVMLEHLTNTAMPSGRPSAAGLTTVSPAYQSRYVASCFNRWISGTDFSVTGRSSGPKISDAKSPIVIAGSSYR